VEDTSQVAAVRYAVGSSLASEDVLSWTEVRISQITTLAVANGYAGATIYRTIPGLVNGQTYYVSLQVQNPGGMWSPSATSTFVAGQASTSAPSIVLLSPSTAAAHSVALDVTVRGVGFSATSVARWNGAARTTTFVSVSELRMRVEATDVASAGNATVSVANGGNVSNGLTFTVTASTLSGASKIYLPLLRR
jgi:hypothetical protein